MTGAIGYYNTAPLCYLAGTATGSIGQINITGTSGDQEPVLVSSGSWTITGAGSYVVSTSVTGGTLTIAADNSLGVAPSTATANQLVIGGSGSNTATLSANGSFTMSAKRGIGLGSTAVSTTGQGAIGVAGGQTLTCNGVIANAAATSTDSLVKTGPGTLVLGGSNTYNGGTTVNAGTITSAGGGWAPAR